MNKRQKLKQIKMRNKKLIKQYPFLQPRNVWTDKIRKSYNYQYTLYDDIPKGWQIGFGKFLLEDLKKVLIETNYLYDFRFMQIKEKYGCYDKETEVLTKDGWKYFKDLSYEDKIATLNQETNKLEYQKPDDIIAYKYNGKMYRLENRDISLCVTPNHNLYVSKGSYHYGKKNNEKRTYPYELVTPDKYFGKDKRFKKGCVWVGEEPKLTYKIKGYEYDTSLGENKGVRHYIKPDLEFELISFLRFLGFYVAGGYSSMDEKHNGSISVAYNPQDEEELVCKLINNMGYDINSTASNCKRIYDITLANWLIENCGHLAPNKKVPSFIKKLPPKYINEFLTYLFIGDGHKTKTYNILTTTSKQLSDDVQELLIKCGYSFRETTRKVEERNKKKKPRMIRDREIVSKLDSYEINWLKLNEIEIDNSKAKNTKSFVEEWIDYSGDVYCVTVPNHVIYIRRNGKGCWCGNSLRLYCNGAPEEVYEVLFNYEHISKYVCIQCGSPLANMVNDYGWYLPICKHCWDKNIKRRKKGGYKTVPYDQAICEEYNGIPNSYVTNRYSSANGTQEIVHDISGIAERILKKYNKARRKP